MNTEHFLAEFFFSNYAGGYKFTTNRERNLTISAIEYINDCTKYENDTSIMFNIFEKCSKDGFISIKTIPNDSWVGSIIEQGRFYYHPVLQMRPKAPIFEYENNVNIVYNNFLEIRKQFTRRNLIDYIYTKLKTDYEFKNYGREIGTIDYMKKRYSKMGDISWLDIVLFTTDEAHLHGIHNPINITNFEVEALTTIKNIIEYSKSKAINKELYRDCIYE